MKEQRLPDTTNDVLINILPNDVLLTQNKKTEVGMSINDLPSDVLLTMCYDYFDVKDIMALSKTNKRFRELISQNKVLLKISLLTALANDHSLIESLVYKNEVKKFLTEGYTETLDFSKVEDVIFRIIHKFNKEIKISRITLSGMNLSNAVLQEIIKKCPDLEYLDLSNCPNLTPLNIPANNKIKSLKLSGVLLSSEELKEIIKKCPNLEYLDLSNCLNLNALNIPANNKIKSLKLSGVLLSSEELQEIIKKCPNLEDLDLSNCPNLTTLTIPKDNKIQKLNLLGSGIQTLTIPEGFLMPDLDLSNCPNLTTLNILANSKIQKLNFSGGNITNLRISEDCEIKTLDLSDCKNLSTLAIPRNFGVPVNIVPPENLNDFMTALIADLIIAANKKMTTLCFRGSGIKNLEILENCKIEELDLSDCRNLTNFTIGANSKIQKLSLANSGIANLKISECCEMEELNCSGCHNLKTLTIPASSTVKNLYLSKSINITTLKIPEGFKIKNLYLSYCQNLTNLTIPAGVKIENLNLVGSGIKTLEISEGCEINGQTINNNKDLDKLKSSLLQKQNLVIDIKLKSAEETKPSGLISYPVANSVRTEIGAIANQGRSYPS